MSKAFRYFRPLCSCSSQRLVCSILLAPALILIVACTRSPTPRPTVTDSALAVRYPTDSARLHLTDHYAKLLRAQLTAEDPYQAHVAIYCEGSRIMTLLTNEADDPLQGQNTAVRLLKERERRTFTSADTPARDRVDSALDGKVFDAQPGCDSLARAGVLGDTVMPRLRPRRF